MQSSHHLFQLHPQQLSFLTKNSCQTFGILITFFHNGILFIFLLWELNADISAMHMFALNLASVI